MAAPEITLLLAGPTGAGKSTTGNKLCGQGDAFVVGSGFDSVTRDCSIKDFQLADLDGAGVRRVRLIDTAGFGDSELRAEEQLKLFESFADQAPHGLDGVLFVVGWGRWGRGVQDSMQLVFEMLGENAKDNTMLIVTKCGRGNPAEAREQLQTSPVFQKWGSHFQGGVACIDNEAHDVQTQLHQHIAALLQHTQGRKWSNRCLLEAREWRQQAQRRIGMLPPDLQQPPRDKLAALLQGQSSRQEVEESIRAQKKIDAGRQEEDKLRQEARQQKEEAAADLQKEKQLLQQAEEQCRQNTERARAAQLELNLANVKAQEAQALARAAEAKAREAAERRLEAETRRREHEEQVAEARRKEKADQQRQAIEDARQEGANRARALLSPVTLVPLAVPVVESVSRVWGDHCADEAKKKQQEAENCTLQ